MKKALNHLKINHLKPMSGAFVCGLALSALVLATLTGCGKTDTKQNVAGRTGKTEYNIGFVQLVDNLTFKEMRDGFTARLKERGYGEDRLTVHFKDAQGDTGTLNLICQEMANARYDVVVPLATPAAQTFVNMECDTPAVFISVADPVGAGILSSMAKPDKNATGTSNFIPVDELFKLADKLTPGIKTYGMIYNLGESNAVATINKAKEYLSGIGCTFQEITVSNSSEVQQAAEALVRRGGGNSGKAGEKSGGIDAFFIPNDSMVVSAMPQIAQIAKEANIPVYGTALVHVVSGALATVGISDSLIGARSADMVIDYLEGTPIAEMPAVTFDTLSTIINAETAKAIGLKIPAEFSNALLIGN